MSKIKSPVIDVDGVQYERIPIKTKVVYKGDDIAEIVKNATESVIQEGDIIFISEKCVAISQGRSYPMNEIKCGFFAKLLSKYVLKTPAGIGLGIPQTMQKAIDEVGLPRILFAAAVSAVAKLFGRKGDFYKIAGEQAASIDGPTPYTIPPYNGYVTCGPKDPDKTATAISISVNHPVAIVDINDLGGKVLGASSKQLDRELIPKILKDNPLGQGSEQTPLGIIRKVV